MSELRTVAFYEKTADLLALKGMNLQFAKSVIDSKGNLSFNMVWQSKSLAPRTTISWTPVYGLNWTLDVPTPGVKVSVGGDWQKCALGQIYDISDIGEFIPSTSTPKANFMNIGVNNYQYGGTGGIHMLVGVQDPSGGFDTVYVDTNVLGKNMHAYYQPQEQCKWWYEENAVSESMISGQGTTVNTYDMSNPNTTTGLFYDSTTYIFDSGTWVDSPTAPQSVARTGLMTRDSVNVPGPTSGQASSNELVSLQKKIDSLEKFLSSFLNNVPTNDVEVGVLPSFIYRGLLNWPAATAIATMTAGATVVGTYLTQKSYAFSKKVTTNPDGSTTTTFDFGPKSSSLQSLADVVAGGSVPTNVVTDWNNAVASDSKDHPGNGGVTMPSSSASSDQVVVERKRRARGILNGTVDEQQIQA